MADALQDTSGMIPVDIAYKFAPENDDLRINQCQEAAQRRAAIAQGQFADNTGQLAQALGGFGSYGLYGTTLLGSQDVTTHVVQLAPPEARLFDFGHADLWLATEAQSLVWQPIAAWVLSH